MDKRSILLFFVVVGLCLFAGCMGTQPPTSSPQTTVATQTFTPAPTPMPMSNTSAALLKDMATLDQAYIPVLALTTQNDANNSRRSMDTLIREWTAFRGKYYNAMPQDPGWKPDLDRVNQTIYMANGSIARGNLSAAHTELEQFRLTMLDLRTRNNIYSFVDRLTLFHDPMEMIVLAAADKAPADVNVTLINQVYPDALARWNAVKTADITADLYGFNQSQADKIQTLMNNETKALENLGNALKTANNTAIGNAAVAIKGPFSILFSAFGKFPS
jgi:hypothetical protein